MNVTFNAEYAARGVLDMTNLSCAIFVIGVAVVCAVLVWATRKSIFNAVWIVRCLLVFNSLVWAFGILIGAEFVWLNLAWLLDQYLPLSMREISPLSQLPPISDWFSLAMPYLCRIHVVSTLGFSIVGSSSAVLLLLLSRISKISNMHEGDNTKLSLQHQRHRHRRRRRYEHDGDGNEANDDRAKHLLFSTQWLNYRIVGGSIVLALLFTTVQIGVVLLDIAVDQLASVVPSSLASSFLYSMFDPDEGTCRYPVVSVVTTGVYAIPFLLVYNAAAIKVRRRVLNRVLAKRLFWLQLIVSIALVGSLICRGLTCVLGFIPFISNIVIFSKAFRFVAVTLDGILTCAILFGHVFVPAVESATAGRYEQKTPTAALDGEEATLNKADGQPAEQEMASLDDVHIEFAEASADNSAATSPEKSLTTSPATSPSAATFVKI